MENEQRTYGLAEWAAALRARRTEEELAAGTRERKASEAYFVVDGHHGVSVARNHEARETAKRAVRTPLPHRGEAPRRSQTRPLPALRNGGASTRWLGGGSGGAARRRR